MGACTTNKKLHVLSIPVSLSFCNSLIFVYMQSLLGLSQHCDVEIQIHYKSNLHLGFKLYDGYTRFLLINQIEYFQQDKELLGKYKSIIHIFSFYSVIVLPFPCSRMFLLPTFLLQYVQQATLLPLAEREFLVVVTRKGEQGVRKCVCLQFPILQKLSNSS